MDLQNPEQKMSKSSSSDKGYIALLDDPKVITKKIKSAVTDSYGKVQYDPINQPGVANLLQIYATLTNQEIDTIVDQYQTLGYKNFKEDLAVVVVDTLVPIQKKYQEILASNLLDHILDQGRTRAQEIAVKKLTKCKRLIGLGR